MALLRPIHPSEMTKWAPFFLKAQLNTIPSALALLIAKSQLRVSQTANENARHTLEKHIEGHRQESARRKVVSAWLNRSNLSCH